MRQLHWRQAATVQISVVVADGRDREVRGNAALQRSAPQSRAGTPDQCIEVAIGHLLPDLSTRTGESGEHCGPTITVTRCLGLPRPIPG